MFIAAAFMLLGLEWGNIIKWNDPVPSYKNMILYTMGLGGVVFLLTGIFVRIRSRETSNEWLKFREDPKLAVTETWDLPGGKKIKKL